MNSVIYDKIKDIQILFVITYHHHNNNEKTEESYIKI